MIPLSMQNLGFRRLLWYRWHTNGSSYRSSVANTCPPLSWAMMLIISCSLSLPIVQESEYIDYVKSMPGLHPTPPTMSTCLLPICAIALSVISTSIANTVSCNVRQRSAGVKVPSSPVSVSLNPLSKVKASVEVRMPDSDTSIPLVVYGKGKNRFPLEDAVISRSRVADTAKVLFCLLLDIVTRSRIVAQVYHPGESIEAISNSDVERLAKYSISLL